MKLSDMLATVEAIVRIEKEQPALKERIEDAKRAYDKAGIGAARVAATRALRAVQQEQDDALTKHRELNESLPPRAEIPHASIILSVAQSKVQIARVEETLAALEKDLAEELAKPNPNAWKRTVAKESAMVIGIRAGIETCQELLPVIKKSRASLYALFQQMVNREQLETEYNLFVANKGPAPIMVIERMAAQRREFEKGCVPFTPTKSWSEIYRAMHY